MGSLLECGQAGRSALRGGSAGILVAEVVDAGALPERELAQGRRREFLVEGSACRLVRMLSRPNMVMNQGSPGCGQRRPALIGENRNAARSTRLRR